jgi:NADH-quinone oxidoreductase subunit L
MAEDERFARYFTYLGLFCFSMMALVLSGTTLQILIFWELVGLCSYLLIGFWYEQRAASNAAVKAFVTNRIGDVGLLVGLGILFYHVGNLTLPNLWALLGTAGSGHAVTLPNGQVLSTAILTVIGVGLFFGAIAKSAQFPLHVWLPDAMEGPTPVSALIHAATMVAAGVYLVGRVYPILTPDAKLFIAIIGLVTLTMGALIATVQSDIKRVLAYSTVSQLGYMMLAMGVGSWVGGLFHLVTHGFFKALLFLGAGSVIHAAQHEQEMREFGGLVRRLPVTALAFAVGVLSVAGTPLMSGYYSKDMILRHAGAFAMLAEHAGKSKLYGAFFVIPTAVAYLTAFYMARCWMLTFWGRPRNMRVYARARENPVLYVPLLFLTVLSILGGRALGVSELLRDSLRETAQYVHWRFPDAPPVAAASWPAELPAADEDEPLPPPSAELEAHQHGEALVAPFHSFVFYAFIVGIGAAFAIYYNGTRLARRLAAAPPLSWVHRWLYDGMYFDEMYHAVFIAIATAIYTVVGFVDRYVVDAAVNGVARVTGAVARFSASTDQYVVDGVVNGTASLAQDVGALARAPQTGRVRLYVTILMVAVALGLAGAVIVILSQ